MDRALVLLVSLFMAGCTPLANSAGGAAPTTRTPAPCPVTLAYQLPPDEVIEWSASGSTSALPHEQVVEAARRTNWVGGGGIWVALPPDGIVTWGTTTQGSKFGLFAYGVGRVLNEKLARSQMVIEDAAKPFFHRLEFEGDEILRWRPLGPKTRVVLDPRRSKRILPGTPDGARNFRAPGFACLQTGLHQANTGFLQQARRNDLRR